MRMSAASGLALLLAFGAAVFAAPAQRPSFLGEWTATAATLGGDVSETLSVTKTEKGYRSRKRLRASRPIGSAN